MGNLPWALAGGFLAIVLETVYRRSTDGFPLIPALTLGLVLTYCVYRNVSGGPSLLLAAAAFQFSTLFTRAGVSTFILHEPLVKGNLVALLLLSVALIVGVVWR